MRHIFLSQHRPGECNSTRFDDPSPTVFDVLKHYAQLPRHTTLIEGCILYQDGGYHLHLQKDNQSVNAWLDDRQIGLLTTGGDWYAQVTDTGNPDTIHVDLYPRDHTDKNLVPPGTFIKIPGYRTI